MTEPNEELIKNMESRASSAEEIISSLHEEIKHLTISRALSVLKAEHESLKQEMASLVFELQAIERLAGDAEQEVPKQQYTSQVNAEPPESAGIGTTSKLVSPVGAEGREEKKKNKNVEKATKQKRDKKDDGGNAAGDNTNTAVNSQKQSVDVGRLDFRVGKIVNVKKHPSAHSLYVEDIDLGEEKPRTVVSGLVKHVPLEEMQNLLVIVLCNLKPANMRGVISEGMVMCASTPEKVEILYPPHTCVPGDKVFVRGYPRNPDAVLNPKKKLFETCAVDLKTNEEGVATYKGEPLWIPEKGHIYSPSLKNAFVK